MPPVIRCVAAGLVAALAASAQSLRMPTSETDRQTPGIFSIILESPERKAPVALQWELVIPPALSVATTDIAVGKAAESARKSLTCASRTTGKGTVRYVCILAGGQDTIGNGPIATVRYRAQTEVQGAPIRVTAEKIAGVGADLKQINLEDAVGIVRIR